MLLLQPRASTLPLLRALPTPGAACLCQRQVIRRHGLWRVASSLATAR